VIEDYEAYLGDLTAEERAKWRDKVAHGLVGYLKTRDEPPENIDVYILGGKHYRHNEILTAITSTGATAIEPWYSSEKGRYLYVGEQNGWLKDRIEEAKQTNIGSY
jgi:hypothetical protein